MNPAEQAALSFCSTLFPDPDALNGYEVTLLVLDQSGRVREVRWLSVDPAATARAVVEANTAEGTGAVYLSAALARPGTPHRKPDGRIRRMENPDIGALIGVWVDIDVSGPAHQSDKRLPPDLATVRRIVEAMGLRPSMIVDSGHGVHVYWLFPEPLIFAEEDDAAAAYQRAAAAARNWQRTMAVHAHRLGRWQIDATHDFSRVLRVPGSTNRKIDHDHRRCQVVMVDETARYELDDIEAYTADPELLAQFAGLADYDPSTAIGRDDLLAVWKMVRTREYRDRGYFPEWLAAALDAEVLSENDKIVKVFRQGHDSGDASTTDISLARLAAMLDLDQRDAAEIIMCYRLRTNHRIEKVDPTRRADYLQKTIGKAFESDRKAREQRAQYTADAKAASARMDAEQASRNGSGPAAPVAATVGAVDRVEEAVQNGAGVAHVAAAVLAENATLVEREPVTEDEGPTPDGDTSDADPLVTEPADDAPPPLAPPADDAPPPPVTDDPDPAPLRPVAAPRGDSVWGSRSEGVASELDALSKVLLGALFPRVRIWRAFTRGRGAVAQRFIQLRIDRDYAWLGPAPAGYHPGVPFNTGLYPAGAFSKLAGWLIALQIDANLPTEPVSGEAFSLRFSSSLIRVWEPDDTGGSLANVVRDALYAYLLDFPPVPSWNDGVAQGMPVIVQDDPRWKVTSPFTVLVRWGDFCRFVKGQYGVNVTPPVMAEMAELAGARVAPTQTQEGRWRTVRGDYFDDRQWAAILHGGHVAEQQRDDRHSMKVVPGGRADDPAADQRPGSPVREAR